MSYELGFKKAGLPLIRAYMQAVEAVVPGLPVVAQKRNVINYKLKQYKDGKILKTQYIESNLVEAFPHYVEKK